MATRLPYLVGEGDIYSRIMGQQAAPAPTTNYYPGFTGGYDPGLYRRRRDAAAAAAGAGSGLLDTGGGGGGDADASGGVSGNPADAIALGQSLSAYSGLLGGAVPGGFLAGLLGKGLTSSGITALGELEADQAALDAASRSMEAVAADNAAAAAAATQAAAVGDLAGITAADIAAANTAVGDLAGITGADIASAADAAAAAGDLGGILGSDISAADAAAAGYGTADAVGASGFDGTGAFGSTDAAASAGDLGGMGAGDIGGGGGGDGGKIICTKLHDLGMMPREIYEADQAFGALLVAQSPETYAGYVIWAKHIVKWMEREDWFGAFVRRAAYAIATPWSVAMAQEMGLPVKSSWIGRALLKNGLRVCQFIGNLNQVRGVQNV